LRGGRIINEGEIVVEVNSVFLTLGYSMTWHIWNNVYRELFKQQIYYPT